MVVGTPCCVAVTEGAGTAVDVAGEGALTEGVGAASEVAGDGGPTVGAGAAAEVAGEGASTDGAEVSVGLIEGLGVVSLVVVVVGAAVAGGATKPITVVAMASEAKAAESRLR